MSRVSLLLLLPLLLCTCARDEPEFLTPFGGGGEFTFRGDTYDLTLALVSRIPDGNDPDFWGLTLNGLLTTDGIQLSIRPVEGDNISAGTYSYCNQCADDDRLFNGGILVTPDADQGTITGGLADGMVTVEERAGGRYRIVFDIMVAIPGEGTERVQGTFEGAVTVA